MFDTQPPARKPSRWTYPGNPYRDGRWTSSELWREKEHVQWLLAEADLDCPDGQRRASSLDYLLLALQEIDEELRRRERLSASAYAPSVSREVGFDRSRLIAEIRERLPAEELLRRYGVRLQKQGKHLVCRCPLPGHEDRHPSFTIFPDGGWRCFGCGRGGDVFELARWMLNERSFVQVVERLGREMQGGSTLPLPR
jgi:hypothetical protein